MLFNLEVAKNLSSEILREIEVLTIQRQYLKARFLGQIIYNEDKNDSNDAAKLYTKLLENSQNNPMWKCQQVSIILSYNIIFILQSIILIATEPINSVSDS
ncbi:3019_t:CDS:2 [Diversispora eburnea]|uniref:3019_t:CDS:1 n=1 Tax=Diversispora eburnea TaxID=1213867 RepID=A0A9N9FFG2_9GLOM|nr:3019_t:CDS:2 [Diversispora eburnea]